MGRTVTQILSTDGIDRIRKETFNILATVGVKVSHDRAKKMLEMAGAEVDHQTDLVRIPVELSEECQKRLPQKIVYAGRDPDKDNIMEPSSERRYSRTLGGAESYVDPHDGRYRKARMSDVKDWAILVDALENITECTTPYYNDEHLNLQARDARGFAILLENTTKHIGIQTYGQHNLEFLIDLATVERGSKEELKRRPRFSIHLSPVAPLHYHGNTIDQMLLAGKYGIPVEICTMPMCGFSAPVTLAGAVLMALAEHLAGVVIHQLASPGAPIVIAPRPEATDMIRGSMRAGSVESAIMAIVTTQVAKEGFGWHLNVMASPTDSYLPDGQAIIEHCQGIMMLGYTGADLLGGFGQIDAGNGLDPALLVIDNEILGLMFRASRGIEVSDETLGLDAIGRVGVGVGKSYLLDEHTLRHYKTEFHRPGLFTRTSREVWEAEGGKGLYEKAREKAISIIKEHKPPPLEEGVIKELRLISERAECEIKESTTV